MISDIISMKVVKWFCLIINSHFSLALHFCLCCHQQVCKFSAWLKGSISGPEKLLMSELSVSVGLVRSEVPVDSDSLWLHGEFVVDDSDCIKSNSGTDVALSKVHKKRKMNNFSNLNNALI